VLSEEPRPQIDNATGRETDDDLDLFSLEKGVNLPADSRNQCEIPHPTANENY
jgi:hypothetical protein